MSLASFTTAVAALALAAAAAAGSMEAAAPPAHPNAPTATGATPARSAWSWPLDPAPSVVAAFDPPDQRWGRGHRGVDLAATVNQPVLSPADGRVSFAGTIAGRGVVVIAHEGGLRSTFEPVRAQAEVGTAVPGGGVVAVVDDTPGHCAPSTCLHWGVLRGETYVDPLSFLTRRPIVLLPLE